MLKIWENIILFTLFEFIYLKKEKKKRDDSTVI